MGILTLYACSTETQVAQVFAKTEKVSVAPSTHLSKMTQHAPTWVGTYETLPQCDKCHAVTIKLTLKADLSYHLTEKYQDLDEAQQPLDRVGLYEIDQLKPNVLKLDAAADYTTLTTQENGLMLVSHSEQKPNGPSIKLLKTS